MIMRRAEGERWALWGRRSGWRLAPLICALWLGCAEPVPSVLAEDTLIEGVGAESRALSDFSEHIPYAQSPDGSLHRHLRFGKLKFIEIVPPGVDPHASLPIVVHFHGLSDRPRLPSASAQHPSIPARILLPRGPYPLERGFAWYPYRVRENRREEMKRALEGTAHHLARFLDEASERFRSPCRPIAVGFSQGGMITLATAVLRPESLEAAIALAAYFPPELIPESASERALPIRMIHGLDDAIVPPGPTLESVEALRERGFTIDLTLIEGMRHASTPDSDRALGEAIHRALRACTHSSERSPILDTARRDSAP